LREALEALKPNGTVPFGRPEWLGFRAMWLRYVECLDQDATCRELGVSRASFYRYHRDAFEAITSILWQRYLRHAPAAATAPPPGRACPAADEAVRLAQAAQRTPVSLADILAGVQRTILPLLTRRGIALHIDAPSELPTVIGDPALLRQGVLNVLTAALQCVRGDAIYLSLELANGSAVWRISGVDVSRLTPETLTGTTDWAMSRELLSVYGGRLTIERHTEPGAIILTLPACTAATILVIDDDGDTIALFRRYLEGEGFRLWTAQSSQEAESWLVQGTPDLVLLDVLMPREDGWDILQQLHTAPPTAHTPVIICSVLSQPQLALSLGASAVLQKPVNREELGMAIRQALRPPGSAATAPRAGS
jgi:CheY-like chemotaxis protein